MKRLSLLSLTLAALATYKVACSPPRPKQNGPLASDPHGNGSPGGTSGLPDVPDLPDLLGGNGGQAAESPCGDAPDTGRSFSKADLLSSIAACTTFRLCEFESSAVILANRAKEYADAPEEKSLDAVQSAFFESLLRWSRLELLQFGPQASASKDPHAGRGVRDLIYSWPNVSRCRVEEQLFGKEYDKSGFDNLVKVPINSRGLFAVEYLSFYEGDDNDCSQFSITNANDAWTETSANTLDQMKRDYLSAVTNDIAARAIALSDLWDPAKGNFSQEYASASAYPDQITALNLTSHALLYVEVEAKDYKIGAPAGLYANAPVQLPEMSFAHGSTLLLQENLFGFRDLFQGCGGKGLGFDDWLTEAGHGDLSEDILTQLSAAEAFLKDFPDLSVASAAELSELHAVIKRLTDHLKTDLFGQGSPLGLTLPTSVEGDTD